MLGATVAESLEQSLKSKHGHRTGTGKDDGGAEGRSTCSEPESTRYRLFTDSSQTGMIEKDYREYSIGEARKKQLYVYKEDPEDPERDYDWQNIVRNSNK